MSNTNENANVYKTYTVSELYGVLQHLESLHILSLSTPNKHIAARALAESLHLPLEPELPTRIIWDATEGVGVSPSPEILGEEHIVIDLSLHFDREEPMMPEHSARLKRESAILEEAFRRYNAVSEILERANDTPLGSPAETLLEMTLAVLRHGGR